MGDKKCLSVMICSVIFAFFIFILSITESYAQYSYPCQIGTAYRKTIGPPCVLEIPIVHVYMRGAYGFLFM